MAETPTEILLNKVDWKRVRDPEHPGFGDNLPFVTHEGILEIAGIKLRAYQLNNGKRILDADDVHNFLGMTPNAAHEPTAD